MKPEIQAILHRDDLYLCFHEGYHLIRRNDGEIMIWWDNPQSGYPIAAVDCTVDGLTVTTLPEDVQNLVTSYYSMMS